MDNTIYVINVKGHPEFPCETVVGETPATAANVYVQGYNVPIELADDLRVYDCYTATMYALLPPGAP